VKPLAADEEDFLQLRNKKQKARKKKPKQSQRAAARIGIVEKEKMASEASFKYLSTHICSHRRSAPNVNRMPIWRKPTQLRIPRR